MYSETTNKRNMDGVKSPQQCNPTIQMDSGVLGEDVERAEINNLVMVEPFL